MSGALFPILRNAKVFSATRANLKAMLAEVRIVIDEIKRLVTIIGYISDGYCFRVTNAPMPECQNFHE